MEEKEYELKLFEEIENIKRALQYYISENKKLKGKADYYSKAYENRVNEYIKLIDKVEE